MFQKVVNTEVTKPAAIKVAGNYEELQNNFQIPSRYFKKIIEESK